jgi:O-antigen/teichoic acid export membrane protein
VNALKKTRESAAGRLAVITVDQVISGASNVVIAILAARLLSAAQFGLFGIVFLVYVILVGVTRALVSDPLLVNPAEARRRPGEAIGTALLLSLLMAAVLAGAGVAIHTWNSTLGSALVALAGCLPLLVLQDVARYLAYAIQRPIRAVVLDGVWLVAMIPAIAALFVTGTHSLSWLIIAWGGAGAAAGLLTFAWYAELQFGLEWLRKTWSIGWRFLVSYTSLQGATLGMSSEIGAVAGAKQLGGVQGTLLLVRPFTTFAVAAVAASTGEVAHFPDDQRRIRRHAFISSALSTTVAAANMVVMVVLPTSLGKLLLGDSWHFTQPLLVPAGLQIVFTGMLIGPQAALLGVKAMREGMTINVASTIVMLIAAISGAELDGARGALWFVTGSQGLTMLAWWATFAARNRRQAASSSQAAHNEPQSVEHASASEELVVPQS